MPKNENKNDSEILIVPTQVDKDGRPIACTRLTLEQDKRENVICPQPIVVIPVVFVPGIMGTNLQSANGEIIWRPPNLDSTGAVLGAVGQMFAFFFRGPATRQKHLNPSDAKVDDRGSVDTDGTMDDKLARERGWGSVMRSSYQPMMSRLQKELNDVMLHAKLKPRWEGEGMRPPADYGEQKGDAVLTEAQLKYAANYRFDVWGGGYNWLKSSRDSSQELIDYIDKTVLAHYKKTNQRADKVILVTHSMGGLVARAIAHIHNYPSVLGVVHGVMPATGAPATYHHARCGYDGVSSVILGRNAREVVPVMCNSPGALELIPSADYKGGQPWLKLGGANHEAPQLPKVDVYEEIYKSREWYGLVPAHNEKLLDPANLADKKPGEEVSRDKPDSIATQFDKRIDKVKEFHEAISKKYPSPAYAHYGADTGERSWETVHWKGPTIGEIASQQIGKDDHNGSLSLGGGKSSTSLQFGEASQPGDGTVPTVSGEAPGLAGTIASFRQGDQGKGAYVAANKKGKAAGYDHQHSYNDPRAQWATLHGIVKIAQEANWHD
jgi:pimeloyl-ACP methyl ester carboxylesterase